MPKVGLALATLVLLGSTVGSAAGSPRHQSARFATWHAELAREAPDRVTLTVRHGARVVLVRRLSVRRSDEEAGPLTFVFLDGGRAPQLLLWRYSGGMHCCTTLQVFDFNGPRPRAVN